MTKSPGFPADVGVAVVTHNGRATLPKLMERLRAAAVPASQLTVFDIGSTDDTLHWLSTEWPNVAVRTIAGNVGPNPARNLALRDASQPILLLLDADAYVGPGLCATLREALRATPGAGMATPVVVHAADPTHIQYAGVSLHFLCEAVNPWVDRELSARGPTRREIGSAAGVALLVDVAVARRIGLFDERYFMGKDDGDFCYRLRMAGYHLVEDGRAVVEHDSRPRSTWMFRFQIRNRWYFMLKNYGARTLIVLLPALLIHECLQFVVLAAKGHLGAWLRAVRDLVSWLPVLPSARRDVQAMRTVPDRRLLVSAPLLVRGDIVGGGLGRVLKRAYDEWLAAYWAVARHLVS